MEHEQSAMLTAKHAQDPWTQTVLPALPSTLSRTRINANVLMDTFTKMKIVCSVIFHVRPVRGLWIVTV